jgi:hypothetical protein
MPSLKPSDGPSSKPSSMPSSEPSLILPSSEPSYEPSSKPSSMPSSEPFSMSCSEPSYDPSSKPLLMRSSEPSSIPSSSLVPSAVFPHNLRRSPTLCVKTLLSKLEPLSLSMVFRPRSTFDGVQTTIHTGDVGVAPGTSIRSILLTVIGAFMDTIDFQHVFRNASIRRCVTTTYSGCTVGYYCHCGLKKFKSLLSRASDGLASRESLT